MFAANRAALQPDVQGSCSSRLFIASMILSCKAHSDRTYSNQSWCVVTRFDLKEVNKMERELFKYLYYQTNVDTDELDFILEYFNCRHLLI